MVKLKIVTFCYVCERLADLKRCAASGMLGIHYETNFRNPHECSEYIVGYSKCGTGKIQPYCYLACLSMVRC